MWTLHTFMILIAIFLLFFGVYGLSCNKAFKGMSRKSMAIFIVPYPIVMGMLIYHYQNVIDIQIKMSIFTDILTGGAMGISIMITGIVAYYIYRNAKDIRG